MKGSDFLNTFLGSVQHHVGVAVHRDIEAIVARALDEAVVEAASHLQARMYQEFRRGQRDGFRKGLEARDRKPKDRRP